MADASGNDPSRDLGAVSRRHVQYLGGIAVFHLRRTGLELADLVVDGNLFGDGGGIECAPSALTRCSVEAERENAGHGSQLDGEVELGIGFDRQLDRILGMLMRP